MKKFLRVNFNEGIIYEVEFSNPTAIDGYWFGDSPKNAVSTAELFPNTPKARQRLEAICAKVQQAKAIQQEAEKDIYSLLREKALSLLD